MVGLGDAERQHGGGGRGGGVCLSSLELVTKLLSQMEDGGAGRERIPDPGRTPERRAEQRYGTEHQRSKSFSTAGNCYAAAPAPSRSQSVPSRLPSRLYTCYKLHAVSYSTARIDTRRTATGGCRRANKEHMVKQEGDGAECTAAWPGVA